MEQLALHIEYLLLRHDCVILPGFGAFINARSAARYDSINGRWIPMTREVRFNQAVNHDDGLLTNSYARKYSLPFHEARILLNSDIKELKYLLENDGEVSFGRLGYISIGDENTIRFSPLQSAEQSSRELGFVSVGTRSKEKESSDKTNYVYSEHALDFDRNYYIPVNKTAAKIAASLVVVFMVTLSALLPSSGRMDEDQASVVPVEALIDSASGKKDKKNSFENISKETTSPIFESELSSIKDNEDLASKDSVKKFYLIVVTFRSESEAKNFIRLSQGEESNLILVPSKTLFRVASASSNDKSELITELNSESFKSRYSEGWIWENK